MISLIHLPETPTVLNILRCLDSSSIEEVVKIEDDTVTMHKKDSDFDYILNGDILDMSYLEFMKLDDDGIECDNEDASETRMLILNILDNAKFYPRRFLILITKVYPHGGPQLRHHFFPSLYITTNRYHGRPLNYDINIRCPKLNLNFSLSNESVKLNHSAFQDVLLVIQKYLEDCSLLWDNWKKFESTSDLACFNIEPYLELNKDISRLIDNHYPDIEYEYSESEISNHITFKSDQHILQRCIETGDVLYILQSKITFPYAISGDLYAIYSYVNYISKYLYLINHVNKESL